jgi:hypothetical protein
MDDIDTAKVFAGPKRLGISPQKRAIYDLRPGEIIVIPHDGYACIPGKNGTSCGLADVLADWRKKSEWSYVSSHTKTREWVVGCYDPTHVEDLRYERKKR